MDGILKQILFLLSQRERRNLFILSGVMIFNALVEVAGVATIAPLIAIMVAPDALDTFPIAQQAYDYLGFESFKAFSIFLGCAIFVIVLVNNTISMLTNYLLFCYAHNREYTIGWKLLKTYLYQPYKFFLQRNSIELLRNVDNEVAYIISNIVNSILILVSRAISTAAIILFIFYVNPKVTIVISLILGLAYVLVFMLTKRSLLNIGKRRLDLAHTKLKLITDSIRIFKDVKMMNAEKIFLDKFEAASIEYSKVRTYSEVVAASPRYIIEIFAISALVFVVIYLMSMAEDSAAILPVLGIYAFAGYRLMPSLQQVYNSLSKIQLSTHSLNIIFTEMKELQDEAEKNSQQKIEPFDMNNAFGLDDVSFAYNEQGKILENFNITINKGERIGIIGRSGSGKSTIIDLLVGLNMPDAGQLQVDGRGLRPDELPSWRANIGYVSQSVYLLDDNVDVNISLESNKDKIDQARMEEVRKLALVDQFYSEDAVGEDGARLSGGQRQRVGIARALYRKTPILIFDEATSALDVETEAQFLKNLKSLPDQTMIFITHRVETLQFCDKIYIIADGKIQDSGAYDDLVQNSSHFMKLVKSLEE